jgi:hypothetical protein
VGCGSIEAEPYFAKLSAAPYFPSVRDHVSDIGLPPTSRTGLSLVFENPKLAFYSAPYSSCGLLVNGVAYAARVGSLNRGERLGTMSCSLPARSHGSSGHRKAVVFC